MSRPSRGPVVVDTGVFGATMTPSGKPLASGYQPLLEGRRAVISFVTVAELRFGAAVARWGPRRLSKLDERLIQAPTIWATPDLVGTYARLRAWCVQNGHGLHQKDHEADRWVAATAIHLGVPLVAHDAIFANLAGLHLITRLPNPSDQA